MIFTRLKKYIFTTVSTKIYLNNFNGRYASAFGVNKVCPDDT